MDKPPSIIWEKAVTSKQNFGKNKALSVQTEFSAETQVGEDTNVCGCVSYVLDTLILCLIQGSKKIQGGCACFHSADEN